MSEILSVSHYVNVTMHPLDKSLAKKGIRPRREMRREKAELPPPLVPRAVLKRYHTHDGRLVIIKSGRVPQFFRVHRENKRLTINLVSLHSDKERKSEDIDHDSVKSGCDGVSYVLKVKEEEKELVKVYRHGSGVKSNPCMAGIKVPVIRQVTI